MDIIVGLLYVQDTGVSVDKTEGKIYCKTHLRIDNGDGGHRST